MIDGFIAVVWIVYVADLFVAAVPGAWTFRGRPGAMRATAVPDIQLAGGFALMRQPFLPGDAAFVVCGTTLPAAPRVARIDAVLAQATPVIVAATTLAVLLLVGLPVLRVGWITPKAWVITSVCAWLAAVAIFVRAFRRVHGRWPPVESWFATLLSPVGASRSGYALLWRSLEDLHPIEVATLVCDDAELLRIARRWVYDAPADRDGISRLLASRQLAARFAEPPADVDGAPQYCPRCGGGFAASADSCSDCRVPLVSRGA